MNYQQISYKHFVDIFSGCQKLPADKVTLLVSDGESVSNFILDEIYQQLSAQYKLNNQMNFWLEFKELEAHIAIKIKDSLLPNDRDIFLFFDKVLHNFEVLNHFMPHAHYEGLECEAAELFLKCLQSSELSYQDTYCVLENIEDIHHMLLRFERYLAGKRNRVFSATLMEWLYKLLNWLSDSIDLEGLLPGIYASETEIKVKELERYIQIIGVKQAYKFQALHYLKGSDLLTDGSQRLAELEGSLKELAAYQSKFIQSRLEISGELLEGEKLNGLCHYAFVLTMVFYFGPLDNRLNPLLASGEVGSLLLKQSDIKLYKELWQQLFTEGKRSCITDLKKYFREGDLRLLSLCWGLGNTEQTKLKEEILSDYERDELKLLRICSPEIGLWILENLLTSEECYEIVECSKALNSEILIADNEQGLLTVFKYIYRISNGEIGSRRLHRFLSGLDINYLETILRDLLNTNFRLLWEEIDSPDKLKKDGFKLVALLHYLKDVRLDNKIIGEGQLYHHLIELRHHAITEFVFERVLLNQNLWHEVSSYCYGYNSALDIKKYLLDYVNNLLAKENLSSKQLNQLKFFSHPSHYINRSIFSSVDNFKQLIAIDSAKLRCRVLEALLNEGRRETRMCSEQLANTAIIKLKLIIESITTHCDRLGASEISEYQTFFLENDCKRLLQLIKVSRETILNNILEPGIANENGSIVLLAIPTAQELERLPAGKESSELYHYCRNGLEYELLTPIFTSVLHEPTTLLTVLQSKNICAQHEQLAVLINILRRPYFIKNSVPQCKNEWAVFFSSLGELITPCLQALNKEARHNFLDYFSSIDIETRLPIFFELFSDSVSLELQYVRCYILGQMINACDPHQRLVDMMQTYMSDVMLRVAIRLNHFKALMTHFLYLDTNHEKPDPKVYHVLFDAYVNCKDLDTKLIFRQKFLANDMALILKIGHKKSHQRLMDAIVEKVFTEDVLVPGELIDIYRNKEQSLKYSFVSDSNLAINLASNINSLNSTAQSLNSGDEKKITVDKLISIHEIFMTIPFPFCRRSLIRSDNYKYLKYSDGDQEHFDRVIADFFDSSTKKDIYKIITIDDCENIPKIINAVAVNIPNQLLVDLYETVEKGGGLYDKNMTIFKSRLLSHPTFDNFERLKEIFKCYFSAGSSYSFYNQLQKTQSLISSLLKYHSRNESIYTNYGVLIQQKNSRDKHVFNAINHQALCEKICPSITVGTNDTAAVANENERKLYSYIQNNYYHTACLYIRERKYEAHINLIDKKNQDGSHFLSIHYVDIRPKENQVTHGFFSRLWAGGKPTTWHSSPKDRIDQLESQSFGDFVLSEISGIDNDC